MCECVRRGDPLPFLIATVWSGVDRFQLSFLPRRGERHANADGLTVGADVELFELSSKMYFCRLGVGVGGLLVERDPRLS